MLKQYAQINRGDDRKLHLVCAPGFERYLRNFGQAVERLKALDNLSFINSHRLLISEKELPPEIECLKTDCRLADVSTVLADHITHSTSLSLTTADSGYKVVYTGDTRPNDDLIRLGRHGGVPTDLLIHEATFQDGMLHDALSKKHSMFSEAVEDGRKMGAKFTLLTHFSQRYMLALPRMRDSNSDDDKDVGIAFDHMTVSPRTLVHSTLIWPLLEAAFPESSKRAMKRSLSLEMRGETRHEMVPGHYHGRRYRTQ